MQKVDLLEGSIVRSLTSLALPIMATSLIQMAYNMTDMIWIGRVSANAVAAVGAAGMYLWLANGLAMIPRLGGQVKVAHELGAQNIERAASYGQAAFHLGALLVVLFTTLCITLNGPLIAFFRLNTPSVTMLMGYKRPDYLAKIGRVHAGGETIDMLEDAIEQQPPYISDYF